MRAIFVVIVSTLLLVETAARGGLVVTSYYTLADTYGYAPTSQTQYFAQQRLDNLTPAIAEVSGDWTGPNSDGTPNTWHYVGNSRASSTTTITPSTYTVETSAAFSYALDTTANFVDPRSVSIFGPGSSAQYNGFFETDVPLAYTLTGQLSQRCRVRLASFDGAVIFNERDTFPTPRQLSLSGVVPPGRYRFLAGTDSGVPNLSPGTNNFANAGSYNAVVFSVQVPESNTYALCLLAGRLRRSNRRIHRRT